MNRRFLDMCIEDRLGLLVRVHDDKYKETYTVDFRPTALSQHKHGECNCREFYMQVHLKKSRTTCLHIDFLIDLISSVQPPSTDV